MIWICFAIFLAACFAAGSTGGLFPPGEWYARLNKPWSGPRPTGCFPWRGRCFTSAWPTAGARVAVAEGNAIAMALWALQIALNGLWTPVFFGLKRIKAWHDGAGALWLSVAATMVALWQVDWIAGLLVRALPDVGERGGR
jgi:benzodiazapine receptor